MNRGIYTAATGMQMGQQWLDVTANNLANISTKGFKAERIAFQQAFSQELRSHAGLGPSIGRMSAGTQTVGSFTQSTKGAVQPTGNPLDVALEEENALFAIQTSTGVQYTRDGAFTKNEEGLLVTRDGFPVLGSDGRTITLPTGKAGFEAGGMITDAEGVQRSLGVYQGDFSKLGAHRYVAAGQVTAIDSPKITAGALEGSNVDAVGSMVEMIKVQRLYEMAQRSVQQQDEMTQQLIQRMVQG